MALLELAGTLTLAPRDAFLLERFIRLHEIRKLVRGDRNRQEFYDLLMSIHVLAVSYAEAEVERAGSAGRQPRIIPGIGGVKLAELDAATLEVWYASLLASGGRHGGPLSPKTVANTAGVLTKALKDAVRLRKLRYNPAVDAELPRRERPTMSAWRPMRRLRSSWPPAGSGGGRCGGSR